MDDALERLDKLTHEEARMAVAQILKATQAVDDGVKGVMDKVLDVGQAVEVSLPNQGGQKKDIIEYVTSVVHSDPKMRRWRGEDKKLVIDTLSERADGM